jgi:predicted AAA+ superfamily ATPase
MEKTYISRILKLEFLLAERSVFLFGPRQSGKSTFIKNQLGRIVEKTFNLLDRGLFLRLSQDQTLIRQEIIQAGLRDCVVCIDEIQKLPELLDEVQLLIEERGIRFLLTGSSARKLRRQGTNLLGGRARDRSFHPLVFAEIGVDRFDLLRALNHGLLPYHYLSDDPTEDLAAYVGRYLAEEISAEGISRNIPAFSRFLNVAAEANGQIINYSNIGNDAAVKRQTVQNWYQILTDTLLGFEVLPYTETSVRKAITTAKYYLFDTGIVRALRNLPPVAEQSKDFGDFFEHFIAMELRAWIHYISPRGTLHFWRSTSDFEVDFILNREMAIEVKASANIQDKHLKGLKALREEKQISRYIVVCQEPSPRQKDGIEILPWRHFLSQLWEIPPK